MEIYPIIFNEIDKLTRPNELYSTDFVQFVLKNSNGGIQLEMYLYRQLISYFEEL